MKRNADNENSSEPLQVSVPFSSSGVLIVCNGREMTVRRVGPVKVRMLMRRDGPPLKPCGWRLVDDVTASTELRALADSGYYKEEII